MDKEYDNTNKGSLFKPDEKGLPVSLQGTINIDGVDHYAVLIRGKYTDKATGEEKSYWRVMMEAGVVFANTTDNPNAPAVKGKLDKHGINKEISAWRNKAASGITYYSVKVEEPYVSGDAALMPTTQGAQDDIDDDIPF